MMKGTEKVKDIFESRDISNWTFGAVIVGIIILVLVIMLLLPFSINPIGRRGATVRSNSMEPVFARGDVVFLEEADPEEIEEGDVIAFAVSDADQEQYNYPEVVVHRVIDVDDGHLFNINTTLEEMGVEDDDSVHDHDDFTARFEEEGEELHENATFALVNNEWRIDNVDDEYTIEEKEDRMQIYEAYPGPILFETQGDAETNPDPFLTREENVIGLYTGSEIPYIGLLFLFANTPSGMATLAMVVALFLIAIYFPWHIDKKEERMQALRFLKDGINDTKQAIRSIDTSSGTPAGSRSTDDNIVMQMKDGGKATIKRKGGPEEREPTPSFGEENIILCNKKDGRPSVEVKKEEKVEPESEIAEEDIEREA